MKTVEILEAFDGYPEERKVVFAKGETRSLPDDFAELIIRKGHAQETPKASVRARSKAGDVE